MGCVRYLDQGVPAVRCLRCVEGLGHGVSVGQQGALGHAHRQCLLWHLEGKTKAPTFSTPVFRRRVGGVTSPHIPYVTHVAPHVHAVSSIRTMDRCIERLIGVHCVYASIPPKPSAVAVMCTRTLSLYRVCSNLESLPYDLLWIKHLLNDPM